MLRGLWGASHIILLSALIIRSSRRSFEQGRSLARGCTVQRKQFRGLRVPALLAVCHCQVAGNAVRLWVRHSPPVDLLKGEVHYLVYQV